MRKLLAAHRLVSPIDVLLLGCCVILACLASQTLGQKLDETSAYSIAVQAYNDGLLDIARDQLQKYLAAYPQGKHAAEAHYLLGDYLFRKGDFPPVVQHVRQALQGQLPAPMHDDAYYLLGRSALETGQYAVAVEAFRALVEPGHGARWHEAALYWSAEAERRLGAFTAAAHHLQDLIETYPHTQYLESALYELGYAYQQAAAYGDSIAAFQQLLQRFPESQSRRAAEYGVARALITLQRFAEAGPYWERLSAGALSPGEAEEATFWWAESWSRAERCDHARPAFQSLLQRFPHSQYRADALVAVAFCAHTDGDLGAEIVARERLVQEFPDDARRDLVLLRLAEAYEQNRQPALARERYTQWLLEFPNHARHVEILMRRGLLAWAQGDEGQATNDAAEVLRLSHDDRQQVVAHAVLAQSYVRHDDCAAARPHLSAVIAQGDQAAQRQARWQRGVCAYRNKAFAAAVEDFQQLVNDVGFDGDVKHLWLLLGESLASLDRDAEAIAAFRRSLTLAPADKSAEPGLAGLAASLLKVGQVETALSVYEQLLTAAPDLPARGQLHLQLGLLYLERQSRDQAQRHLAAAATSQDEAVAAEATYRLANLLFAEGLTDQAADLLRQLTTRLASQPAWVGMAAYRLALFYEAEERWPEAWQAYIMAVKTATDPHLVEAARERAQHLEETVDVHVRREPDASQAEQNL